MRRRAATLLLKSFVFSSSSLRTINNDLGAISVLASYCDHRHTAAVHMVRAGMPLNLVQQQLGLSSGHTLGYSTAGVDNLENTENT